MRYFEHGKLVSDYQVSFGQASGPKRVEGDRKTPTGLYYVVQKHRGEFDGPFADYYGGYWIRINYPNKFDAQRGKSEGLITEREQMLISKSWNQRQATLETTKLGGGIGFHGWIKEWDNSGSRHLSWGCVVMHPNDINQLYARIPVGAMVVIF
jgi:murein L,D-transpeptidase YafK